MDAIIYRSRTGTTSKHSTWVSVMVFRQQQYWRWGMQLSIEVELEQPPKTLPGYQLWYLDSNNIGDGGCNYLSLSKWNNLQTLDLSISYGI